MRAHRFTGNGDTGITGMQSGAVKGRWRWIVNPVYAASEPGLGNSNNMRKPLITTLQSNTVIIQVSHDKVSVKLDRLG